MINKSKFKKRKRNDAISEKALKWSLVYADDMSVDDGDDNRNRFVVIEQNKERDLVGWSIKR